MSWLRKIIRSIEELPLPPGAAAATLCAIIALRHVLEMATGQYPIYSPVQFFVHYPLAYLAPLLTLSLLLAFFSGETTAKVVRLMLFAWLLTLIPPIVDILASKPHGDQIGYLIGPAGSTEGFLSLIAKFFDPRVDLPGTTRGIRVEAALACLLGALYVFLKRTGSAVQPAATMLSTIARSVACGLLVLPACLFFFTLPIRFFDACRLLLGDFGIASLYGQTGRLQSVEISQVADMVAISYLSAFVLAIFVVFARKVRDRAGRLMARRLLSMRALMPAACAVIAAAAARSVSVVATQPGAASPGIVNPPPGAYPAEFVAMFGIGLASLLAGACLPASRFWRIGKTDPAAVEQVQRIPLEPHASLLFGGLALGLAAGLGGAPLALIAGLIGVCVLDTLPPLRLESIPILGELIWGAAALLASLAGASLFFGREVLVRMPPSLALAAGASGALLRLTSRQGEGGVRAFRAVAAGLAVLSFPMLLGEPRLAIPLAFIGAAAGLVVFAGESRWIEFFAPLVVTTAIVLSGLSSINASNETGSLLRESLRSPYLHLRQADAALSRGDRTGAATAYRAAIDRDSRFTPALTAMGQMLLEDKDYDAAIGWFRNALDSDPESSSANNNLGAALLSSGHIDEAQPYFEAAVKFDPANCGALYNRAVAADRLDQHDAAIAGWSGYLDSCASRYEERSSVNDVRERLRELGAPERTQAQP